MLSMDHQHLAYLLMFVAGLALSVGVGWALIRLRPGRGGVDAALLFLAPVSLYTLGVRCALPLLNMMQMDWASGRLSPAVALLHGYSIYYPPSSGPIFNTIYAPLAYLVYLPAGLLGSPTEAILAGGSISHLLTLGPILLLCLLRHGEGSRGRSWLLGASVFFAFWKFALLSVLCSMFVIHADAPALGFGVMSCLVLYAGRRDEGPSARTMSGSAMFIALAIWSKQTALPLAAVLPAWVLLAHGPATALRFSGWTAATTVGVGSALMAAFGRGPMLFNILEIPKNHPWLTNFSAIRSFSIIGFEELSVCVPPLCVIALLLYGSGRRAAPEGASAGESGGRLARLGSALRANYWALFAAAGAGMVPLSMISRIKFGGEFNNYSPPLFYLSAAACACVLGRHERNRERGLSRLNEILKIGVLVSPFSPLLLLNFEMMQQIGVFSPPFLNVQEQAYRYALKHPSEAYFPWNPLSSLMAEGRAYHFEYGVFDRELGGFRPSDAHYRGALPEKMRMVAYPPNRIMEYTTFAYLWDFKRRVQVEELPGWICYER